MRLLSRVLPLLSAVALLSACAFPAPDEPAIGMTRATLAPTTATTAQPTSAAEMTSEVTTPPVTTAVSTSASATVTSPIATTPAVSAPTTTVPTATSTAVTTQTTTITTTTAATTVIPTATAATIATTATTPPTTVPTTVLTTATTTVPPTTPATTAMTLESLNFGATPITVAEPNVGGEVYGNAEVTVDATDKALGYVLVKYHGAQGARLKVLVTGPSGTQYTYHLNDEAEFEVFPFSDGNGDYTVGVYRNTTGNKYATVFKTTLNTTMCDAYAAFLHPNQYVNYNSASQILRIAAQLTAGLTDPLAKVEAIYRYVTETITYDYALAASVQSGYLPDVDAVVAAKKGICFDYAAVMTAMLRGLGVPTKLVVGYCGTEYHAWINVHVEGKGWVNEVVFFDGSAWNHMDPTYAAKQPEIGDFSARYTYTEKFIY